jgi:CheY-like chemotaxis protein
MLRKPTGEMEPQAPQRTKIVVINDDTPFLQLMQALLEDTEGYDVAICKEWDNAFEFVRDQEPDLVILDIVMGREERGWTILNLLTLSPQTRPIPVLVCSAAIQSLVEHAGLLERYGIRALAKPFDLNDLLIAIEQTLHARPRRPDMT